MALSFVELLGDGSSNVFTFQLPLGFLDRNDISVEVAGEVDGTGEQAQREIEWITDGVIRILGDIVADGVVISVKRTVDKTVLENEYEDGSALTERNLDNSFKQSLMIIQELMDGRIDDFAPEAVELLLAGGQEQLDLAQVQVSRSIQEADRAEENADRAAAYGDLLVGVSSVSEYPSKSSVELLNIDPGVMFIRTAGFSENGDGGSALYRRVVSEPVHDLKVTSADGSFWEGVLEGTEVRPEQFGARRNGVSDDSGAINSAAEFCSLKNGNLHLQAGVYRIDSTVSLPANVSMFGAGMDKTVLDGSLTSNANLTGRLNVTTEAASYVALPALQGDVSKGATTLSFASAPNVEAGDVIVVYNPTGGSFSAHRTEYRAGEQLIVQSVSGTNVTVEGSVFDAYISADVGVYKLDGMTTARFEDFTVKGLNDASNAIIGFRLKTGHNCSLARVKAYNASLAGMSVENCVGVVIEDCVAKDDFLQTSGTDYGLAISNSREFYVRGGHFVAASHGITIGGGGAVGDVPNRFFRVSDVYVSSNAVQAADVHGNSEYGAYVNCVCDGGLKVSGDHIQVIGNQITGTHYNGPMALVFSEMVGCNFTVEGNTIESAQNVASRGNLIDVGGNSSTVLTNLTTRGGVLAIRNNTLIYSGTVPQADLINVSVRGYNSTEPVTVDIRNNTSSVPNEVFPHANGVFVQNFAQVRVVSGTGLEAVTFKGNSGVGGLRVRNDLPAGVVLAKTIDVSYNTLKNGLEFRVFDAGDQMIFRGNNLTDMAYYCGYVGDAANPAKPVYMDGNVLTRCGWARDGIRSSLVLWNAEDAWIRGNFLVGSPKHLRLNTSEGTPGSLEVGEVVTGETSGATAVVYELNGGEFLAVNDTVDGTFTDGENIVGTTSAATAELVASNAVAEQRSRSFYFDSIATMWNGQNVDSGDLAPTASNVTTNTAI